MTKHLFKTKLLKFNSRRRIDTVAEEFFLTYYPYFFPVQVHQSSKLLRVMEHIIFWCFRTRSGARTITEDPYSIVPEVNSFITNEIINGNRTKCFYQKNLIIKCIFYISNLNSENSILLICDKNEHFWHSLDPQQLFVPHAAPEFKSIEQKIV